MGYHSTAKGQSIRILHLHHKTVCFDDVHCRPREDENDEFDHDAQILGRPAVVFPR